MDDLLQVASLGLMKAVDRWDPERGTAFSTFAVPTILGELRRYFRDSTWAVNVPRSLQDRSQRALRERDRLAAQLGREPTVAELGAALGCGEEEVLDALEAARAHDARSLDAPLDADDDEAETYADIIGMEDAGYAAGEARVLLDDIVGVLRPRAREVLKLRFEDDLLQSEIAERVGCSQMQVSRVIRESLEKLARRAAGA